MVSEAELVEKLAEFGLDDREAKVYYHLSRLGPSPASEVSRASGVQRTEVYRVMDALEQAGFVEKTLERPRKYIALEIEDALARRLETKTQEIEELERTRDELSELWPRTQLDASARKERFSVHQGRSQIRGLLERMVDNAQDEINVMTLRRGMARLDTMGVLEDLADRSGDGVSVRVLTEVEAGNQDVVSRLAKAAQVRHVDLPGYAQLVIVDNEEIALFVSLDPLVSTQGTGETVLWLNAQDFILAQKALFDTLWSTGIDQDDRLEEIETGRLAEQTEIIRGRWMRYNRMKEMLYRAEDRVLMTLTSSEAERLGRAGIGGALERLASQGVKARVVAPEGSPELEGIELAHADESSPLVVLVVDGEEVLAIAGADRAPGSMAHEDEWAIWSTVPETVEHFTERLQAHGAEEG